MNPINPIIVSIGRFEVRWYGVLIMVGVALGAYFAAQLAKKRGLNPDHIWSALIVAVLMGILGARLYHVFSTPAGCPPDANFACGWPYYRTHFFEAFAIWKSGGFQGLGIYGAILGGILGVTAYSLWNHLKPLVWLDMGAAGLAFGQFVGRWGNFINQELYGPPTGSDWFGLKLNPLLPHQEPPGKRYDLLYHPTFLYESLWSLGVFLILYNDLFGYRRVCFVPLVGRRRRLIVLFVYAHDFRSDLILDSISDKMLQHAGFLKDVLYSLPVEEKYNQNEKDHGYPEQTADRRFLLPHTEILGNSCLDLTPP